LCNFLVYIWSSDLLKPVTYMCSVTGHR